MYPYQIRLRGPWEITRSNGPPLHLKMPARWDAPPLADLRGELCFTRKFGAPRQLEEGEQVWLVGNDFSTPIRAEFNGQRLGSATANSWEFPVSLAERNRLVLTLTRPEERACAWGEVAMEVRRLAWLAPLTLMARGLDRWSVSGLVMGNWPDPLELYVMAGGQQLFYREIIAGPLGQPFEAEFIKADWQSIKVELVNLATVWYSRTMNRPGGKPSWTGS